MLAVFFWVYIFVHCLCMSYSSEVSQTFPTVISSHFTVAACLPLYTCVSLNPCTSNSCHVLLTVLSQDTLSCGRADSPDILLQTQSSSPELRTPSCSKSSCALFPFSCCTSHLAAPECTYPHCGQCLFPRLHKDHLSREESKPLAAISPLT